MAEEKNGAVATVEPRAETRPQTLFEQMDREFDDLRKRMRSLFRRPAAGLEEPAALSTVWAPTADAYVKDGKLNIKAELAGVKPEDITVTVEGKMLTIEGKRTEEKETRDAHYYAAERFTGSFMRTFAVPDGVDPAAIEAVYKDGVLAVTVPLPAQTPPTPATTIPVKK